MRLQAKALSRLLGAAPIVLALLLPASCRSATGPNLEGGILVEFDVNGELYKIFITNTETIEQVFALRNGQSNAKIPSGRVLKGQVWYNKPWSWHIDSQDIHMAEVTIELCDGTPSYVEAHLDEWIETVGRFCPWSARLVSITDYR